MRILTLNRGRHQSVKWGALSAALPQVEAERRRSAGGRPEHGEGAAALAGARLSAANIEKQESAAAAEDARAQRRSDPKARTRAWLGSAELAPDPTAGKPGLNRPGGGDTLGAAAAAGSEASGVIAPGGGGKPEAAAVPARGGAAGGTRGAPKPQAGGLCGWLGCFGRGT